MVRSPLPVVARAARALSSVAVGVIIMAAAGDARARRQEDDDKAVAEAPPPVRTGKPVAFDSHWLEPFFTDGPAKAAADLFRAEDFGPAEAAFAKALKKLPAGAPE